MPNQLIQPYVAGTQSGASVNLYDPRFERENRARFRRDLIPELMLANALYVPGGRWPARAWVLVRRGDYNAVSPYAANLQLQVDDLVNPPLTFKGLTVVQARCVSTGIASSPDAVYLVELTDARGQVWAPWFSFPTTSQYNVISPAYPDQYYSQTLNPGTGSPWTWNDMLSDLWTQIIAILGAYPGMPIVPVGTPEGYSFPGTPAWKAISDILDQLGCAVAADLTATPPYSIIFQGQDDPAFTALQARWVKNLLDDLDYIDLGSGRVPKQVVVLFHRRNTFYGTEETIRRDALQWQTTPFYSVTVPSPARFSSATGTHYLWDDFTIRYDIDNAPLAADIATAAAIAADRVNQYYERIYTGTIGYLRQVYAGALPFKTGSLVEGVCWRQRFDLFPDPDTRPTVSSHRDVYGRAGWVTEVVRGAEPPWPEVEVHEQG